MFRERFKELRETNKYTKKFVAKYLEMSPEGYGYYESGKRNPSPETIAKLAQLYGVTTDYLLGTDEAKVKINEEDLMFALFNGNDGITEEMYEEVKNFAQYIKEKRLREGKDVDKF